MAKLIKSILANRMMFRGGGLVPPSQAAGILASSSPLIDSVTLNEGGPVNFANGGMYLGARPAALGQNLDALRQQEAANQHQQLVAQTSTSGVSQEDPDWLKAFQGFVRDSRRAADDRRAAAGEAISGGLEALIESGSEEAAAARRAQAGDWIKSLLQRGVSIADIKDAVKNKFQIADDVVDSFVKEVIGTVAPIAEVPLNVAEVAQSIFETTPESESSILNNIAQEAERATAEYLGTEAQYERTSTGGTARSPISKVVGYGGSSEEILSRNPYIRLFGQNSEDFPRVGRIEPPEATILRRLERHDMTPEVAAQAWNEAALKAYDEKTSPFEVVSPADTTPEPFMNVVTENIVKSAARPTDADEVVAGEVVDAGDVDAGEVDAGEVVGGEVVGDAAAAVTSLREQANENSLEPKDVEAYVDVFLKAMPKYEGKSKREQGFDIIKMGMAIAAGQSPHAITNISKGVLATIDNFTSDEKERRAYKRQIDLSAVQYGLANVARDHTELRADAKEGRQLYPEVWRVRKGETFRHNGKEFTEDDTVILTVDDVRSGDVDISKLHTEDSIAAGIKAVNNRLAVQLDALHKTVTDPSKFQVPMEKYMENASTVRTNIATQGMLKNALAALNADDVTGIKGTAKDILLKISNATGLKEFSEEVFGKLTTKAEYIDFTERATTQFIEGLISEGGKISDFERGLARELSGAIGTQAFSGVTADTSILQRKIRSFVARLGADSDIRLKTMGLTEQMWDTRYNTIAEGRVSYGQMLRDVGGPLSLGRTASKMLPGSVNWKDIISVASDGVTILGLKPREDW